MGAATELAGVTPPESPRAPAAEINGDAAPSLQKAEALASNVDLPCVTALNGIGIKGLKVPETSGDAAASKKAILAATSEVTVGRVPDGTVFSVPETHDLIQTLFSPSKPKTLPEYVTLGAMAFTISLFFFTNAPKGVFLAMFLFWRFMYNVGLGVLLSAQSKNRALVRLARKHGFGPNPVEPRKKWVQYFVDQVSRKMTQQGKVYDYEAMPIEFNVWVMYRGLVDIILVNDFTCYIAFAVSYYQAPAEGYGWTDALRYAGGILMLLFNLWVKTDAHRVVKDFAWYWGDFFFLVDASLTFDGVFEMAPHPMYSVGYIGFYGTALIAQSYSVLFVSLLAHAAQMAFLHWVENPHIDKTYNPPTQKKGRDATSDITAKYFGRDMIVFRNMDLLKATDLQTVAIVGYTIVVALLIGPIDGPRTFWFYVGQTLFWRLVHTYGLGTVLYLQSQYRMWNRHFIKHGESSRDAFNHWKVLYNTTQVMTYVSFVICAVRLFVVPESIVYGTFLLRATLGGLFILLHIWIAVSIYEVIGSSGWFYGDFFIDELRYRSGPVYSGLYRYLDNPLLYTFSCWGLAMICGSPALYGITIFGQVSNWFFLRYVEQPHMRRLYGPQIRQEAGVERVLKSKVEELERSVERIAKDLDLLDVLNRIKEVKRHGEKELKKVIGPEGWKDFVGRARGRKQARKVATSDVTPPESDDDSSTTRTEDSPPKRPSVLRKKTSTDSHLSLDSQESVYTSMRGSGQDANRRLPQTVERIIEELEDLVDQARPRMRAMVGETAFKLAQVGEKLQADLIPAELYSLSLPAFAPESPATFKLGQPIEIQFTAAADFITARDWVGIYPITANPNQTLTTTKSEGRWLFVNGSGKEEWDADSNCRGMSLIQDTETARLIGTTVVEISTAKSISARKVLPIVRGTLTFTHDRLPWQTGAYEARYHYEGKHGVMAISRAFEIVADEFSWHADESVAQQEARATQTLRKIVQVCVDVNTANGDQEICLEDDIMEKVKIGDNLDEASYERYKETVARRIAYAIKQTFGVEFSWKVVPMVGTTGRLAQRVCSAHIALHPTDPSSSLFA
ncbi:phospholipid methyltransferase-domain-containing protein [Fimicolochytrium jonesii]|uniref:phospholipid methyltransferase-domain-containing protein n=1 Tax=Fimicolochytrium jonesii TaxID=1396493 RepID=UPI0022FF0F51|nr:phospholipid methyltransferase-domain-containing protein [Fimicolochytrium jonesii]KAI8817550.1 phospholipid methyltransferase-domain-containing protein [Fimicolochytrium jonesii]